jgi:hypothetical protein
LILESGPSGHWVFLDDLQKVAGDLPELIKFFHSIFNFKLEKE